MVKHQPRVTTQLEKLSKVHSNTSQHCKCIAGIAAEVTGACFNLLGNIPEMPCVVISTVSAAYPANDKQVQKLDIELQHKLWYGVTLPLVVCDWLQQQKRP